ncbi:MMPL family transporter [Micromonospora globispora]|uniref:MMPL family transporter n=2 Tax=Micromonospora globispora TaxID=1450148 RepID=UPI0021AB93F8|nr:MMPL family transporter [Micromonospora globispora]
MLRQLTSGSCSDLMDSATKPNAPPAAIGWTVAAAGLILAGTFGVLMLAPISFLQQMGFAVAIGIVLSAFVMSMFFVPALTALIGHKAWWPGHGDERPVSGPHAPAEPATVAKA